MSARIMPPTDPEEREFWRFDPAGYEATERLHGAAEELIDAVDAQAIKTGVLFAAMHELVQAVIREKGASMPTIEQLLEARQRVERAQAEWAAAVSDADALLRQRQEGGA